MSADDRNADVAADQGGHSGLFEDFAEQRGGGGFAVGAGDGQDFAFEEAGGQFEFADDGEAEVAHLGQFGCVERNAGADDDQVLAAEGEQAVAAGFDVDALFEQGGNVFGEGFGAADVGDGDLGAAAAQKQGRGQAGFTQADDQYLFAFELHHEALFHQAALLIRDYLYCAPLDARMAALQVANAVSRW